MQQMSRKEIGLVFMVEPGHYEWPAILLASSLMAFAQDKVRLYAYCRAHLIEHLHKDTIAFFEKYGIELRPITPEFAVIYPQGNKLYACADKRAEAATILFDTDMFQLRPFLLSEAFRAGCISGRPTGDWMWGKTVEEWALAYQSVGLDMPHKRMARPSGSYVAPTISAGFVAYDHPDFGQIWTDVALEIEQRRLAKGVYPTLDQISLPVAAVKADLGIHMLDVGWNKAGAIKPQALRETICYHYQHAKTLLDLPVKWMADKLLKDFAGFDTCEDLIDFYACESAQPDDVLHNKGFREKVILPQRDVDERHDTSRPSGPKS